MGRLIKVCGITRLEDALLAVEYGANALGFNFFPGSPRYIDAPRASTIIKRLPPGVAAFGVFVGEVDLDIAAVLHGVQVHGLKRGAEVPTLAQRVLVATSPAGARRFPDHEIIIDTSWGRGQLADWEALRRLERPYILSGGLTPENVSRAVELLDPAGVDVCSGVEVSPGVKNPSRLRAFLAAVQDWASRNA